RVSPAAHRVVSGAKRATGDDAELRHLGGRDRRHQLGAVLRQPLLLVTLAYHEAGNVLEEEQGDAAMAAELDEVGALEAALRKEDAVVGKDADGKTHYSREAADQRCTVEGLELLEAAAVDKAGDDLAHVERPAQVRRD